MSMSAITTELHRAALAVAGGQHYTDALSSSSSSLSGVVVIYYRHDRGIKRDSANVNKHTCMNIIYS